MKLGKPENFLTNTQLRLESIKRAISNYKLIASKLKENFNEKIDNNTTFFLKGFGNEIDLLSCFRELFFNSRELLDTLLIRLNKDTAKTQQKFLRFAKKLMNGDYDTINLPIILFLKTNFTYVFHIRKVRNEIKYSPANIEFRYNTNRFESFFRVPVKDDERELIKYLEIKNMEKALLNKSYSQTWNLDVLFPEMLQFWQTCLSLYNTSKQ